MLRLTLFLFFWGNVLTNPVKFSRSDCRLPTDVKPNSYGLYFEPNLTQSTFSGLAQIYLTILKTTKIITLHSHELKFSKNNVDVRTPTMTPLRVLNVDFDKLQEFVYITLEESLEETENYVVTISYNGTLNNDNRGLYKLNYVDSNGMTRWFVATQFAPTYARQAFPCFDEPSFKATFMVQIRRTKNLNTLSNVDQDSPFELDDGTIIDIYKATPVMSTYLLAFVISDFTSTVNGTRAVYARPQAIQEGRGSFALDLQQKVLYQLEEYTNIRYNLPKLYQVAIPDQYFMFGAMENWGLITYKEKNLLFADCVTTANEEFAITTIIAHEHSHQWFGNLVTPEWWKYVWLNEGFARFFQFYTSSQIEPSWDLMAQFSIKVLQYAFESDSSPSTRSMTFDAETPEAILLLFDRIAYDKSAAVIRMMQNFLTESVFRRGVTSYLNDRKLLTATEEDLWGNLQKILDTDSTVVLPSPFEEIMSSWTSLAGYPVIHVTADLIFGSLHLTQERFLTDRSIDNPHQLWPIPISYVTELSLEFQVTTPSFWLTKESQLFSIPELAGVSNAWVILNTQQIGYYRVNYDSDNWNLLIGYLNSVDYYKIHETNRAQLIDDVFNLARAGYLDYGIALNLTNYTTSETNYIPLYSFLNALSYVDRLYSASDTYLKFTAHVIRLLQNVYHRLGVDLIANEPFLDRLNRINILNWLVKLGDEACLEEMHKRLSTVIPPDLEEAVYCGGVKRGGNLEFVYVLKRYNSSTENLQRTRLVKALGCAQHEILINYIFSMIMDEHTFHLREEDRTAAFIASYSNGRVGVDQALNFFVSRYNDIVLKFTSADILTIINGLALKCVFLEQREKLANFINRFADKSDFATALNHLLSNSLFSENREKEITAWFEVPEVTTITPTETSSTETSTIETSTTETSTTETSPTKTSTTETSTTETSTTEMSTTETSPTETSSTETSTTETSPIETSSTKTSPTGAISSERPGGSSTPNTALTTPSGAVKLSECFLFSVLCCTINYLL